MVLAVKPNVLDEVAPDLVQAGTPVLSILAGTSLKTLHEALPGIDLVRVMPNLGAQVRQAVLCVVYGKGTGEAERGRIAELLGLVGDVIELDEEPDRRRHGDHGLLARLPRPDGRGARRGRRRGRV